MLYQLSYASVLPNWSRAPNKHSSPCPLGQTLRLTQGQSPCNLTSNQRKTLKPFDFASNGDLQLATPAGLIGWGFC